MGNLDVDYFFTNTPPEVGIKIYTETIYEQNDIMKG